MLAVVKTVARASALAAMLAPAASQAQAALIRAEVQVPCLTVVSGACGSFADISTGSPSAVAVSASAVLTPNISTSTRWPVAGSAYADLTTGNIGAAIEGAYPGQAYANLRETVHFSIAGATSTTQTIIDYTFGFDGVLGLASQVDYLASFSSLTTSSSTRRGYSRDGSGLTVVRDNVLGLGVTETSPDVFQGQMTLLGANPDFNVFYQLFVSGADADFSNTARFSFSTLPSGVTWTSDSGVFLTSTSVPVTPVPEPATYALLIAGLALLAAWRRKQGLPHQQL